MRKPASPWNWCKAACKSSFLGVKRQNSNYATNHRHRWRSCSACVDKSVKDKTVELAKQKQILVGYDNNIKALGYPVEKTSAGAAASVESLKNVSGYKGTLRKVIARQEQGKNAGRHQSHANAEKPDGGGVRREKWWP